MRLSAITISTTIALLLAAHSECLGQYTFQTAAPPPQFHQTTQWDIQPSMAFDALCLLNTLTADPFYMEYYSDEYAVFKPKLTPAAIAALTDLKRKVKDEAQSIISASLCLYLSATDDSTLDDLIATLKDPSQMQANLRKTTYYSDDDWKLFESVKGDLGVIFHFLKDIKFEDYWRQNRLPKVTAKIDSIKAELPKYNIVPEIETMLGTPLSSDRITVYMLTYSQPHGIKITGMRFLTDIAWPFSIVIRNAIHEMMHPPYHLEGNKDLTDAFNSLKSDSLLMDKVTNHNPSFGYNSFEGFMEEDCVQALDQIIGEKLGVSVNARARWKQSDDGMHMFAIALYQVIQRENYNAKHERFDQFLVRVIRSRELGAGTIGKYYAEFYK